LGLIPLKLENLRITPASQPGVFAHNIAKSRKRLLPGVERLPEWRLKPIAIVGGGPSLADTIDELRVFDSVMAAGSCHDYLVSKHINLKWCILTDPDPVMAQYLKMVSRRTRYLVASCCADEVFDALDGYDVAVWNCYAPDHPDVWQKGDILVHGGCTVGTRAIYMAMNFGFRDIHLFGFDSCIREEDGAHHAYDFATSAEQLGDVTRIFLEDHTSKGYLAAGYMIAQIAEVIHIFKEFNGLINLTVHGEGPLADYAKWLGKKVEDAKKE
jgi:uncharacterized Rossmann fold enzyme